MAHTLEELELMLGPPETFIIGPGDLSLLREWAIAKGNHPFTVGNLSAVELTNLYHGSPLKPSAPTSSIDIHETIVRVLEAVNAPGFEVSLTRNIAREEMRKEILSGEATKQLIQETLDRLAPRQIHVVMPTQTTHLEGLQHYMTEKIIRIAALGDHIMLVGPAGCGKTFIGETVARALQLPFYITSTINDTHELTGFVDGYGKYHSTPFRNAFEFGGVWVADEIDAWDASALLAANAALANGYANFPDSSAPVLRHNTFRMVATANTFGNGADRVYIGRNELDAASLDRFAMVAVDYDLNLERMFSGGNSQWLEHVWQLRKKVLEKRIRHVVSSRAIQKGARALSAGLEWNDVNEFYLFKGMSAADREKVT